MNSQEKYATLGIDIGSTTVKIAILDEEHNILFSDYERHFANIRETLSELLKKAYDQLGELQLHPMITGSGGLTLANHLGVPFTQEVVAVATSLQELAPKTDVAIELGGEDAKIIYFEGGNVEQRMNGICAGGNFSSQPGRISEFFRKFIFFPTVSRNIPRGNRRRSPRRDCRGCVWSAYCRSTGCA